MNQKKVLMVHGITDTGKIFQSMGNILEKYGYQPHTIDLIPSIGIADLRDLAQQLKQFINNNFHEQEKINLIGFSMGGLVTRYYLQRLNGIDRVNKYVSISAPNNGTNNAHFLPLKGIQQMRPNSEFLQDLNNDVKDILSKIETLVMWTPFDAMILPPKSSVMGVGKEVNFPVLIHRWMLEDKRVFNAILNFLGNKS
ncbi:esterase/lipase family protein [Cyanobacterium aponinum]|uniref:Alpha/beta fold hydrolase n=1 Tax=Cyanobacterium aponinum 0216 TaxID=2676140 RepID=A0A844GTH1_9CHRO|nr:alpha/beta fold hydrolase [Cyanobacterium aponinum]MTF39797.1 alpha/beta fold hydrolase [Cyanobacterium aponinum 0216]